MAKETSNTAAAASAPKTEPVFTKADLIEHAAVFKTTPALMTGALYGVEKDNLTRKEAADALAAFLKKPVHGNEKGVK